MSIDTSVPYEAMQTAYYTLLQGVITGNVYDEIPDKAVHPYTTFGEPVDTESEARGVKGRLVTWPFHVWSKDAGGKFECYGIMKEIVEAMTAQLVTVVGWAEIQKTYRTGQVRRLEKLPGLNYQGTVTFMILMNKV